VSETFAIRAEKDYAAEQKFLTDFIRYIEKGMGKVAARTLDPALPIPQRLDALDRGRELAGDMYKQVRVRPLEEAIAAQQAWLDRAEARLGTQDGEPKVGYNRIALDRRLLQDLLARWRATRN
jgi:hypothetical protein